MKVEIEENLRWKVEVRWLVEWLDAKRAGENETSGGGRRNDDEGEARWGIVQGSQSELLCPYACKPSECPSDDK